MKGSAPGARLQEIERLGELARAGNELRPPVSLNEEWGAEYEAMTADDRAQLDAAMREVQLAADPRDPVDYVRDWEALMAGERSGMAQGGGAGGVSWKKEYVFQT
jgi:hypothetical protein